jgi:hypothetical protein
MVEPPALRECRVEVTTSEMLVGSRTGVVAVNTSGWKTSSDISGVTGVGGKGAGVGVGAGADLQKDRLRVDPSPTITLDRGFGV